MSVGRVLQWCCRSPVLLFIAVAYSLCITAFAWSSSAEPEPQRAVVTLDASLQTRSIVRDIEVLHNGSAVSLQDLIRDPQRYDFQKNANGNAVYGRTSEKFWARVQLRNTGSQAQTVFLQNTVLSHLNLYLVREGKLLETRQWRGPEGRESFVGGQRFPLLPLTLPAGETVTLFAEFWSGRTMWFDPSLVSESEAIEALLFDGYFYGAYFGIFLTLLVFYTSVALAYRARIFALYPAYIALGLTASYLLLNYSYLTPLISQDWHVSALLDLVGIAYLYVTAELVCLLMNIPDIAPRYYKQLPRFYTVAAVGTLGLMFIDVQLAMTYINLVMLVGIGICFFFGSIAIRKRQPYAVLFTASWGLYQAAGLALTLSWLGFIPYSAKYIYAVNMASIFETTLFAIILALHMRVYRQKAEQVEHSLEQVKRHNKELELVSSTDALTGVLNRRRGEEILHTLINDPAAVFSVYLLDIDSFKSINDRFGHDVGDSVIKQVVALVRRSIRSTDKIVRWGGEEFVVILTDTQYQSALARAEVVRDTLATANFDVVGKCTASFGVATRVSEDSVATLVRRADIAMYGSKRDGRNRVS